MYIVRREWYNGWKHTKTWNTIETDENTQKREIQKETDKNTQKRGIQKEADKKKPQALGYEMRYKRLKSSHSYFSRSHRRRLLLKIAGEASFSLCGMSFQILTPATLNDLWYFKVVDPGRKYWSLAEARVLYLWTWEQPTKYESNASGSLFPLWSCISFAVS